MDRDKTTHPEGAATIEHCCKKQGQEVKKREVHTNISNAPVLICQYLLF